MSMVWLLLVVGNYRDNMYVFILSLWLYGRCSGVKFLYFNDFLRNILDSGGDCSNLVCSHKFCIIA